jgi:hypothetical protein
MLNCQQIGYNFGMILSEVLEAKTDSAAAQVQVTII